MLGERVPARQALDWGLINRVVADARVRRGGRRARRAAGAPGRRAPTPAPSASSTPGCTPRMRRRSSTLEASIQQEMAASGDFVGGRAGLPGAAGPRGSPAAEGGLDDRDALALRPPIDCRARGSPQRQSAVCRRAVACAVAVGRGAPRLSAPAASAGLLFPESGGSPNARRHQDALHADLLILALVVFVGVEGVLIWSLFKYRARARRASPRRSTATRASRSAGRSARR